MSEEQNNNVHSNQGYYGTPYYQQQYPAAYHPYYQQYLRQFPIPQQQQQFQQAQQQQQTSEVPGMLPLQQSYIENILRLNRGKEAKVYMTFENDQQRIFQGIIEAAGRDHIIVSDPRNNNRYLLLMVYLDYVEFDDEINYSYPGVVSFPTR